MSNPLVESQLELAERNLSEALLLLMESDINASAISRACQAFINARQVSLNISLSLGEAVERYQAIVLGAILSAKDFIDGSCYGQIVRAMIFLRQTWKEKAMGPCWLQ